MESSRYDQEGKQMPQLPPSKKSPPFRRRIVEDVLKKDPGEWYPVEYAANAGHASAWKKMGCEIALRSKGNGKHDIWVMWPAGKDEK